jgi:poly-beta-1,6-N-acetyl-D-glucosamine N-deacetylase
MLLSHGFHMTLPQRLPLALIIFSAIWLSCGGGSSAPQPPVQLQIEYDKALLSFESGLYTRARRQFLAILARYPGSAPIKGDVVYRLGETYARQGLTGHALTYFDQYINNYPEGRWTEQCQKRKKRIEILNSFYRQRKQKRREQQQQRSQQAAQAQQNIAEAAAPQSVAQPDTSTPPVATTGSTTAGDRHQQQALPEQPVAPPDISPVSPNGTETPPRAVATGVSYADEFPQQDREEPISTRLARIYTPSAAPILGHSLSETITPVSPAGIAPAPVRGSPPKLYAAQILYLRAKTIEEMGAVFDRLKAAGFNAIIFRVFQNVGDRIFPLANSRTQPGVYFQTEHAPVVADLLTPVLQAAHDRGLMVFAWMTTRYADYGMPHAESYRCIRYNFETRQYEKGKGLTIFSEDVISYLENLYADLARYPVDGILFQDDLVLRHTEGFSVDALNKFEQRFGIPLNPFDLYEGVYEGDAGRYYVRHYTERYRLFARFKNDAILELVRRLQVVARRNNPNVYFAINLMYEAITMPDNALLWLAQDAEASANAGIDYFSVMAYHRQMARELEIGTAEAIDLVGNLAAEAAVIAGDPNRVLIKIQTRDWKDSKLIGAGEVGSVIERVGDMSSTGVGIVPYDEGVDLYAPAEAFRNMRER